MLPDQKRRRLGLKAFGVVSAEESAVFQVEATHGYVLAPSHKHQQALRVRPLRSELWSSGRMIRASTVEASFPSGEGESLIVERYAAINVVLVTWFVLGSVLWRRVGAVGLIFCILWR